MENILGPIFPKSFTQVFVDWDHIYYEQEDEEEDTDYFKAKPDKPIIYFDNKSLEQIRNTTSTVIIDTFLFSQKKSKNNSSYQFFQALLSQTNPDATIRAYYNSSWQHAPMQKHQVADYKKTFANRITFIGKPDVYDRFVLTDMGFGYSIATNYDWGGIPLLLLVEGDTYASIHKTLIKKYSIIF